MGLRRAESTVSNTELSEFFGPHRDPGRELSEFLKTEKVFPVHRVSFWKGV